jgi:hypothetical protein
MIVRQLAGRSVAAGAIGMLCLAAGGLGVATAANGGSLVLGQHNTATSTTTLETSDGTPLSLVGKKSKAPLKVSSSTQVKHLNASLLGGQSARQLAVGGSAAQSATNDASPDLPLSTDSTAATLVARTGHLAHGTYYVIASAELHATGVDGGFCFVARDSDGSDALEYGGANAGGYLQAAETVVAKVKASHTLGEYCYGMSSGVTEYNAGILTIRVADSKHGKVPPAAQQRRRGQRAGLPHGPGK